jgi:hypothetical protein
MSTGFLWCSDEFVIPFQFVVGSVGPCSTLYSVPIFGSASASFSASSGAGFVLPRAGLL